MDCVQEVKMKSSVFVSIAGLREAVSAPQFPHVWDLHTYN